MNISQGAQKIESAAQMQVPSRVRLSRVLVADDEPAFLETTCDILRKAGYEANGVSDAESVMEQLGKGGADILVTDIRMPGSDSLEYLQRALESGKHIPTIVVTGYPSISTAAKAVKLPVVAYLTKPLDIDGFLGDVRRAVGLSRLQGSVRRTHERAKTLAEELEPTTRALAGGHAAQSAEKCFGEVVGLLFANARAALTELEEMFSSSLQTGRINYSKGDYFRPLALVELLQQTVILLERSKRDFKSRELAELRKRIERLLELPANAPSGSEGA